ncbi:MAG: hypothetical protein K2J77_13195 [Oscillospiraceae bacterium]|nr:hypothetical protein [Oscillospiraceae bacterium]
MEIYENILGNLTPSELDELAPADFNAKAPRGAVKRIGKAAVEKTGICAKRRKRYFKPLMIAAAAVVASVIMVLTVNASTGGMIVNFQMGGKEIEGNYRDYVDHDGYRNVSFKATIPFSEEYYVVIFDVEGTTEEDAVRVITSDTDPDYIDGLRQYRAAKDKASDDAKELWDRIYAWKGRNMHDDDTFERDRVKQEALEAGVFTADEWPKRPKPEDYGIVLKDNELLCYNVNFYYDSEYRGSGGSGYLGGEFMFLGEADEHPSGCGPRREGDDDDDGTIDYENGTLTRKFSFFYYVGKK